MFLYKIKDEYFCFPTYGFYPMFIDFATSFVDSNNKNMLTSMDNYQSGIQSTIFDPLSDSHHFLLSLSTS